MNKNNLPIGVFDSGVGGLTVVKEIFKTLPNEKIIYFGDTARVPYGGKSRDTIIRYSKQISDFLISQNVKAIVIACNTASALALDSLCETSDIPILGVVKPGARAAVKATKIGRIGVIGTVGTIGSRLYEKYIHAADSKITVFGKACPLFVPLVEEGIIDDSVTEEMIRRYLCGMVTEDDIDTLILGCTHYPLIEGVIARGIKQMQKASSAHDIVLVNPARETAQSLAALLEESGLSRTQPAKSEDHKFFVSDDVEKFVSFAKEVSGINIANAVLKTLS